MPNRGKSAQNPPHHPHDKGYRQLLTNKKTFLELLQTFVAEGWVREIKEGDLTLINKSYVLQDFSDKEADIVYRMRLGGSEIIFYVLLELQSTVDHTMPFRLLQYMVEIWRDIYKNAPEKERRRKNFKLPAIVPAVLYNGKKGWTAHQSFREYQSGHEQFPGRLLDFSYILFDVVRYNEEDLHRAANVVSSIFYLDQTLEPQELGVRLRKLADILKELDQEQFRQITVWMRNVIKRKLPGTLQKEIERVLDETEPREVEKMITNIERTLDDMKKQTLIAGKLEGKVEVAKIALKKGFTVNDVAEITGLSVETVLELKKELEN
ncbi:Rpn family recombination-promoting nuclease/putative transposase [Desulfoscipio gibsoniae]|uniref:Transposase (putative) YhgA-like domain-containing protein n=1 Tax=Desulfoscipio gibsoniae DSM 7213 TaxID=767817 RepID=R4KFL6_9FIRM|nr:Rpn family recombination-promoting nuclease/putative transposase [Desulfoscipio gibsoniae]AGL01389.1 hypothetical protein Desgi_1943 [Desulfoscipio gibsoniae DSM 7213]